MAYHDKFLAAAKAHDLERFWTFVITLPEEVEAMIPKGTTLRKKIMAELKKFTRKLFSLKTEDGLCAYANIHAVGDSDLRSEERRVGKEC